MLLTSGCPLDTCSGAQGQHRQVKRWRGGAAPGATFAHLLGHFLPVPAPGRAKMMQCIHVECQFPPFLLWMNKRIRPIACLQMPATGLTGPCGNPDIHVGPGVCVSVKATCCIFHSTCFSMASFLSAASALVSRRAYSLYNLGRNLSPLPQPRKQHALVTSGM